MKTLLTLFLIAFLACDGPTNYQGKQYIVQQVSNGLGDTLYEVQVYFISGVEDTFIADGYREYHYPVGNANPYAWKYTKTVADSICKRLNEQYELSKLKEFHQ
jgi:hypothetical protein